MGAGSLIKLRTLPVLPIIPARVLPHSIWNQISIGVAAVVPVSASFTNLAKFF
jgi:hypothetical protein